MAMETSMPAAVARTDRRRDSVSTKGAIEPWVMMRIGWIYSGFILWNHMELYGFLWIDMDLS